MSGPAPSRPPVSPGLVLFLAFHFATWISSLSCTTVACSVMLANTTPIWVGLMTPWAGLPGTGHRSWGGLILLIRLFISGEIFFPAGIFPRAAEDGRAPFFLPDRPVKNKSGPG